MALRDSVIQTLRQLLDIDREERAKAESPSADALKYAPSSIYAVWGREDVGSLLSISQSLNERFLDYEAMLDYPDIHTAFRYFASDSTQPNMDNGRVIWTTSNDAAIVGSADTLFRRRLRLEDDAYSIAFELAVMGNGYTENLVTDNGLIGLNVLPAPTMRRVEKQTGELVGFVQDITGRFTADQEELRRMLSGATELPPYVALFEDWQVNHLRLKGTSRRSPYGCCIPAGGQVWTSNGPVSIDEVKVGDRVLFRYAGMLRTTQVVDTFTNGVKPVFKLKTTHRTIRATANHPFLRWRGGKNNTWEQLGDLKVGEELVVATECPATGTPPPFGLKTDYYDDSTMVRLTARCVDALKTATPPRVCGGSRDIGLRPVLRSLGYTRAQAEGIGEGKTPLRLVDLKTLLVNFGLTIFTGAFEVYQDPSENPVVLPDFVTPQLCRLLGFLLGDGWLTAGQVCFARGTNEDQNQYYEGLAGSFGVPVEFAKDRSQCRVTSTRLVQAIRSMGWIDGARHKRVPSWVFTLPTAYRRDFLTGFVDADGWTSTQSGSERTHVELCNYELVRDLKTLIDGLGWTCGNIRRREPREGRIRAGLVKYHGGETTEQDQVIKGGATYTITWHETALGVDGFAVERIESIEPDGEEEVFDIGVANEQHNFVCDGLVVHNSIAESARYIWKRLVMLEDAVMINRLTRVPRNVFYHDMTDVPPAKREGHLRKARKELVKKSMVDPRTGRIDSRAHIAGIDENYHVGVSDGRNLARVEVLSSPEVISIQDVDYFQRKLHGAIGVPRSFLGQDGPIAARSTLAGDDVRAARVTLNLQKELRNGFERMVRIDQAARGYPNPWQTDFEVCMTVPSGIYELAAMEVRSARADFAARIEPYVSMRWIQEHIFKFNDQEIEVIEAQRQKEALAAMPAMPPQGAQPQQPGQQQMPPSGVAPQQQPLPLPMNVTAPNIGARLDALLGRQPTQSEQSAWDRARRTEERKEQLSRQNHQQLVDKFGKLMTSNQQLAERVEQATGLINDMRQTALQQRNGYLTGLPAAHARQR